MRDAVAPVYLFLCLLLGGSAQGLWANAALQILAVTIIGWAAVAPDREVTGTAERRLRALCVTGLLIVFMQLIPLPPSFWSALPGRQVAAEGYALLGQEPPWMALTLVPDETLTSVLRLLPAAAVLVAMVRLNAYRRVWLAWALIAGTCAGVLLGALQAASGAGPESPWYLYPISNFGTAVGFFANGNHMASLLVATIPFLFALLVDVREAQGRSSVQRRYARYALAGGVLAVILLGLVLNGSLAGLGLGLPVLAASVLLLVPREKQRRWLGVPLVLALAVAGAVFLSPVSASLQTLGASESFESRRAVAQTSARAARDFMPVGSGIGSFEQVYRLYEKPETVGRTFVNHAHNDYLELAIETGLPGILWMLLFLAWWFVSARDRWGEGSHDSFSKAGTIASAAILAHSLVDFPLRTSAMSAVFAASIALVASVYRRPRERTASDIRPTRHFEIR